MSADAVPELLNGTTALILDMCGTFMFGHDRFRPDQAYDETYRLLGGATLSNQDVCCAIDACFLRMNVMYLDAARHNSFPSVLTKSSLAQAIRYTTSRWPAMTRFIEDDCLGMSNNAAERAIRPIAVGRHNWTFAGSDTGGERSALMHTLIETAKLNGLDPEAYLRNVIDRIADHPAKRINDLLPWNLVNVN
jgi:Transposase IS66 family/IS66 C-terminal element